MMKLQITEEYCSEEIYKARDNNPEYKKALEQFKIAVETGDPNQINDAEVFLETMVSDIVYTKGLNEGFRLALSALAGKDIAEMSYT